MSDMREAARMIAEAFVDSGRELSERAVKESAEGKSTAVFQGRDSEGKPYVMLPGSDEAMPVSQMAVDAKAGDSVRVSFKDGRALVEANLSDPAAGVGKVDMAQETAEQASGKAESAKAAAANAQVSADAAGIAAASAQGSANQALADAASTRASAERAAADAASASASAASASADAAAAMASALNANEYAARALSGLATVESVTETLTWITEHGTMALTSDTQLDMSHVYFVVDSNGEYIVGGTHYSLVIEPDEDDLASYYELAIDESLQNYVGTHLALTGEGLWLLPDSNSGFKVLVATGAGTTYTEAGTFIIDDSGGVVGKFTNNGIEFGSQDGARVVIDTNSMRLTRYDGTDVFAVGGLIDADGKREVVVTRTVTQSTDEFTVDTISKIYGVEEDAQHNITDVYGLKIEVDGVEAEITDYHRSVDYGLELEVTFSPAAASGSEITCTYYVTVDGLSFLFGVGEASGGSSSSFGKATASNYLSFAIGESTASNRYSYAEGYNSVASGMGAHAEGGWNDGGSGLHDFMDGSKASGTGSHAEGAQTVASGWVAHSEGVETVASGDASHAQNMGTKAGKYCQTAIGTYNVEDTSSTTTHSSGYSGYGKYAAIIGNGDSEYARSNALAVQWNGQVDIAGETCYPIFTKSSWSTSSSEASLPVTPCFVLSLSDFGLYYCSG